MSCWRQRVHCRLRFYRGTLMFPGTRARCCWRWGAPNRSPSGGATVGENGQERAQRPGYRLMLREMAPDERPRERLKLRGATALSDGDLLAIILNTGIVGETVTDLSQRLL